MTTPNDPSACELAAEEWYSLMDEYQGSKRHCVMSFKAGWSECEKTMQHRISDLEDQLYHESRKTPEVEYKLGHRIEELESKLEVARTALETLKVAVNDKQPDPGAVMFISKALAQLTKESK